MFIREAPEQDIISRFQFTRHFHDEEIAAAHKRWPLSKDMVADAAIIEKAGQKFFKL